MSGVELLAAPVMRGARYRNAPIYFSDVLVRAESAACSLDDLRGQRWAYNEPTSHSGFALTRWSLASRGLTRPFFGEVIASGAHLRSLELLLSGRIDATAMDSTVLETELRKRPSLRDLIRAVETLGPSPIPPLVISRAVPSAVRSALQAALLEMHRDIAGAQILAEAAVSHFVPVSDPDYDPIRAMARLADQHPRWHPPISENVYGTSKSVSAVT